MSETKMCDVCGAMPGGNCPKADTTYDICPVRIGPRRYWINPAPTVCDLNTSHLLGAAFVDGKTDYGPWANMCLACHAKHGFGFGEGRGQKYEKQGDGRWLKTRG